MKPLSKLVVELLADRLLDEAVFVADELLVAVELVVDEVVLVVDEIVPVLVVEEIVVVVVDEVVLALVLVLVDEAVVVEEVVPGDEVVVVDEVVVLDEVVVVVDDVVEAVLDPALHPASMLIILLLRVTAPFNASKRPSDTAPVLRVIEVSANMFPTKSVPTPNVAELPTCQKMLQALAPFVNTTTEFEAVMRVEAIWKTQTLFGLVWPSKIRVPVNPAELVYL